MADPAIPALSSVTSEALQERIRTLLPSQQGFGVELAASNIITPIIDLTPAAEGSQLQQSLREAWDASTGHVRISGAATTTIVNNTGFWKVRAQIALVAQGGGTDDLAIEIFDGATAYQIWDIEENLTSNAATLTFDPELIVFLRTGDLLRCVTAGSGVTANFHFRQLATVTGTLVNPTGYTPQ